LNIYSYFEDLGSERFKRLGIKVRERLRRRGG